MDLLITIIHELRRAKGTNKKKEILKLHKDNELWIKFLKYTYDERITYNVSAPKSFDFDVTRIDERMFESLDKLAKKEVTGKAARELALDLSYDYGEIPRLVLNRSIKAGISITTVNNVYDNIIPIFKSMKGVDCIIPKWPVETSIKYDGVKAFVIVRDKTPKLMSSSGAEFVLDSLINDFKDAIFGVYEGELTHKDGKQVHRPVISGQLNSLLAGTKTEIPDYVFRPYDWIPIEEWDFREGTMNYDDRYQQLKYNLEYSVGDSANVEVVTNKTLHNSSEVEDYFNQLISEGYEGTMHRYADDPYMWERTNHLIKKKSIRECILKCVGVIPHTNPLKGNIGSLVCEGTIKDKIEGEVFVKVNIGSGLSKMDIQYSDERYIGENIEALYNTVTISGGEHSLFLPRFKRISKRVTTYGK